jgi:hypothetical protein
VLAAGYLLVEIFKDAPHALITGGAVTIVLMGTTRLFKRQRGHLNPIAFQRRVAAYVALTEILLTTVITKAVDGAGMAWAGLVAWFSVSGISPNP